MSTSSKKTDSIFEIKWLINSQQLQPQPATLQKILQFASAYRVEKVTDNQYVELFLN
ncbi:MAG: hypothetical protein P4L34_13235 [Paludibacter sp.]|nr:hypothetical protein [Paludibacter sp.]